MVVETHLSPREAYNYLTRGTSEVKNPKVALYRLRRRGLLRCVRISGKVFYAKSELDHLAERLLNEDTVHAG